MSKQAEKSEAVKPEDKAASEASAEKRIERVAEQAAEQSSATEKLYDSTHTIFSN